MICEISIVKIYKIASTKMLTVQDMGTNEDCVPIITLRGKWLMSAGFFPKDRATVDIEQNKITITMVEQANESQQAYWETRTYNSPEEILRRKEEQKQKRIEQEKIPNYYPIHQKKEEWPIIGT